MSNTRPDTTDPRELQRWKAEREQLERLVGNDRDFREEVLVSLTELKAGMGSLQRSFEDHVKSDENRFDKVNQSIGDSSGKLQYMFGGAAVLAFVVMAVIAIARLVQP